VQTFGYFANARLTSERNYKVAQLSAFLGNPAATATEATASTHDNVGNRTATAVTTPADTDSTAYAHDDNDRRISETLSTATGSTVTTTYTWDGNGNLARKSSPSEYTAYAFDADNRLIEVRRGPTQNTATAVAVYGHDGDGQRLRKTTSGRRTRYLVDTTPEGPQVVLESAGPQATAVVWGDALRQQPQSPTLRSQPCPESTMRFNRSGRTRRVLLRSMSRSTRPSRRRCSISSAPGLTGRSLAESTAARLIARLTSFCRRLGSRSASSNGIASAASAMLSRSRIIGDLACYGCAIDDARASRGTSDPRCAVRCVGVWLRRGRARGR